MDDLIHLGYAHASLIGILRPDVKYPDRHIASGRIAYGRIDHKVCTCPDEHVEVWVRPVPAAPPPRRLIKRRPSGEAT